MDPTSLTGPAVGTESQQWIQGCHLNSFLANFWVARLISWDAVYPRVCALPRDPWEIEKKWAIFSTVTLSAFYYALAITSGIGYCQIQTAGWIAAFPVWCGNSHISILPLREEEMMLLLSSVLIEGLGAEKWLAQTSAVVQNFKVP